MLLTLRGTPFLYYGEEIGMHDVEIPAARVCDPVGKRFSSLGRDPERTPMQWDDGPSAGFSRAADTWLPLAPDHPTINVARQAGDPASLLSFYRRVIWYRKSSPALRDGAYRALDSPSDTFVYLREHPRQRLLVALNFAGEPRTIVAAEARGSVVLGTAPELGGAVAGSIALPAVAGAVVEVRS